MPDQADQLRELVRQTVDARPVLGPGLPIVVVSGGVAGVGATTLAMQLARELARLGKPAVLVDAHLSAQQLTAQLSASAHGSLADVLAGNRSAIEIVEQIGEGVHLLPTCAQGDTLPDLSQAAVSRLLTELRGLNSLAEVAIVDAGYGLSPWVQRWWRAAQQVFLVTTTADAAVKASYVTLKLAPWGDADGKVRLVVNRCDDRAQAEGIADRFARTCRRFLGLHVEGGPVIACSTDLAGSHEAFRQSVRLLATEVMSGSLLVSARAARRGSKPRQRVAEMLALPELSPNSANNSQLTAAE